MLILQFTGMPGAGKSTLATALQQKLLAGDIACEVIDGDAYRKTICSDLGYSAKDRRENIRRLAGVAATFRDEGKIAIIAAINPFDDVRMEIKQVYQAKIIWVHCDLESLIQRDPKGLYRRALLPADDPQKIHNLTGIDDPYETPSSADLVIDTGLHDFETCINRLFDYTLAAFHELQPVLVKPAV